jgi:carbon storage regulator
MLVLTRKIGEKIYIGEGITLTVVQLKGNTVRLGIEAPQDVPIVRAELTDDRRRQCAPLVCLAARES